MSRLRGLKSLLPPLMAALCAGAHAAWPERPVRIIVPYLAGSMGDNVTRLLSEDLRARLGQPVIVETRPGGGGNIGAAAVAQAPADGHTVLMGATNNFAINQFLYKDIGFDPQRAFDPVTLVADVPSVIYSAATIPPRTWSEFLAWAAAQRGQANFGSPGNGTTPHLVAEMINRRFQLRMAHIPYKGAGQALQALMAGEIHLYLAGAGLGAQQVRAGRMRALAVAAPARVPSLPDTPTLDELGIKGLKAGNWWALAVPRGTPRGAIDTLAAAVRDILAQQPARERMNTMGLVTMPHGPDEMARTIDDEVKYWKPLLPTLDIKPE